MTHVDILAKFLEVFPMYQETIRAFTPAGMNTIIVEFNNNQEFKFTYYTDNNWTFGRYRA